MIKMIVGGSVIVQYRRRMGKNRKEALLISDIIRKFRHEKNLSQADLGGRLGIEQSYISLLEVGKRTPSVMMLIRIAAALEVSPGAVVDEIAARHRDSLNTQ